MNEPARVLDADTWRAIQDYQPAVRRHDSANPVKVWTDAEIQEWPALDWLAEGRLIAGSFVCLYGTPGVGKGFVLVDLLYRVLLGWDWHGSATKAGGVVYYAAERANSIPMRARTWWTYHGRAAPPGLHVIKEKVSLSERSGTDRLIAGLQDLENPPAALAVDTLARTILPGHENDTHDMGVYCERLEEIREAVGCAVIVVHHQSAGAEFERGNKALRASCDTMIELRSEDDGTLKMSCTKQNDADEFDPVRLALLPYGDSAVATSARTTIAQLANQLSPKQREVLESLALVQDNGGASNTKWQEVAQVPVRTYYECRKVLQSRGLVEPSGKRWKLTSEGAQVLGVQECK